MKFQTEKDLKQIFSIDFEAEYFVKLIENFELLFIEDPEFKGNPREGLFMLRFLKGFY
jgi:hypothetical protein